MRSISPAPSPTPPPRCRATPSPTPSSLSHSPPATPDHAPFRQHRRFRHRTLLKTLLHPACLCLALVALAALAGCTPTSTDPSPSSGTPTLVPLDPALSPDPLLNGTADRTGLPPTSLDLSAVRNEWVDTFLSLPPASDARTLRVILPRHASADTVLTPRLYRVMSLAFDTRSVPLVRDRGPGGPRQPLPAALIPLQPRSVEAGVATYRLPADTALLYLELQAPLTADAGTYTGSLALEGDPNPLPVTLALADLALSDTPSAPVLGTVPFADLIKLFPAEFTDSQAAPLDPRFVSRTDRRSRLATERLDQIVRLCRAHRLDVAFTGLQPIVKLTPREGLRIDWTDYDDLVLPWLTGETDPQKLGVTAFPLPLPDAVVAGALSPGRFYQAALSHFDQRRLLSQTVFPPAAPSSVRITPELLAADPEVAISPDLLAKVRTLPARPLPAPSLQSLRHLAWAAALSLNPAGVCVSSGVVTPDHASAAPEAVAPLTRTAWFYPAAWFSSDVESTGVVPAVGLKWARRAQQDRELLDLAARRGRPDLVRTVASAATRQTLLSLPSPIAADLLTPLADPAAFSHGIDLIRQAAALSDTPTSPPTTLPADTAPAPVTITPFAVATEQYTLALASPLCFPLSATYTLANARLTAELACFAADLPDPALGPTPESLTTPTLSQSPDRLVLRATLDPALLRYPPDQPFGPDGKPLPPPGTLEITQPALPAGRATFSLPTALALPAQPPPDLDGRLDDWSEDALIYAGKFVRFLDRPSAQTARFPRDRSDSRLYATWTPTTLYLAFRLENFSQLPQTAVTNFAPTTLGRASGDALVQLTLTPATSPSATPLRLLLKPTGLTPLSSPPTSAPVEPPRFAATLGPDNTWRVELAIPAAQLGLPALTDATPLALNLIRHDPTTGVSSSLAGPLDTDTQPVFALLWLASRPPLLPTPSPTNPPTR